MDTRLYIADTEEVVDHLLENRSAVVQMNRSEIDSDSLKELLRVFAQATAEVMATLLGVEASQKETILVPNRHRPLGEITSAMKLTGEICGTVAVSFNTQLARELSARIAGCTPDDLSPSDVGDGVGEITNQISGRARTLLNLRDRNIEIDLPTLVDSDAEPTPDNLLSSCYAVIFESLGHRFALQLSISD